VDKGYVRRNLFKFVDLTQAAEKLLTSVSVSLELSISIYLSPLIPLFLL
jgi:hypothetical protein